MQRIRPSFCFLERPPAAHFSQQLEKWAKEPEETDGFFTSLRAMHCAKLRLHPAGLSGVFGERSERCLWQMKRGERVAAVKISAA